MENQSTPTEDNRASDKRSSNQVTVIATAIFALLAVVVFSMFLLTNKQTQTVYIPATTTSPTSPSSPPTTSGTYLKVSITPDDATDNPEEQAIFCAQILKTKFSHTPYKVGVIPNKEFIDLFIDSQDPEHISEVIDSLTTKAKLSIHLVHRQSRQLANAVSLQEQTVKDYITLPYTETTHSTGETPTTQILIRAKPELTQKDIKSAWVSPRDHSLIHIELNDAGGVKMHDFTTTLTKNIDMIATVLNGQVVNYATLAADSLGKNFVINGLATKEAAEQLVHTLQNPLTSTLSIIEQKSF
ncbi:MAG: SecDF P1 head subdomain-containing protein [Akkermansiaceae bacterium]